MYYTYRRACGAAWQSVGSWAAATQGRGAARRADEGRVARAYLVGSRADGGEALREEPAGSWPVAATAAARVAAAAARAAAAAAAAVLALAGSTRHCGPHSRSGRLTRPPSPSYTTLSQHRSCSTTHRTTQCPNPRPTVPALPSDDPLAQLPSPPARLPGSARLPTCASASSNATLTCGCRSPRCSSSNHCAQPTRAASEHARRRRRLERARQRTSLQAPWSVVPQSLASAEPLAL
jgi:hypothetical protein